MSLVGTKDPNRGPFKLEYDETPKNLYSYDPQVDSDTPSGENYRYQGFPDQGFEKPRNPVTLDSQGEVKTDLNIEYQYFPQKRWFDTRKPLGGSAHTGLQYGTDHQPQVTQSLSSPRAIRDPFNQRTSAELCKFRRVQEEVDEDFLKMKAAKLEKKNQEMEEKLRDMAQLKDYNPWGRPGCGAPVRGDNRKQKFTEEETESKRPSAVTDPLQEYGDFLANFGRSGAGAPLRTTSGNLKAELRGDPSIRFQQTKDGPQIYEKEVRYKADVLPEHRLNLGRELKAQVDERKQQQRQERLDDLRRDIEMAKHDPYGKPGAGAPNQLSGRKITLTTNTDKLRAVEKQENSQQQNGFSNQLKMDASGYDPWGKGYGAPVRDSNGDTRRYKWADRDYGMLTEKAERHTGNSLNLETGRGGAGAPCKTEDGRVLTRFPITMKRDDHGDSTIREQFPGKPPSRHLDDPELQIYDPWGKGGGGAPLKDTRGHPITQVFGKIKTERMSGDARARVAAKQEYLQELQTEMKEQRENRIRQNEDLRKGNGEFAALIKAGRVGRPKYDSNGVLANQHLTTTDVTQEKTYKTDQSQDYLSFLEREAEERDRIRQLDKLKDRQEWKHHQQAMNDFWGRPGGGAPLHNNTRKGKLEQMIHSPRNLDKGGYAMETPWASEKEERVF